MVTTPVSTTGEDMPISTKLRTSDETTLMLLTLTAQISNFNVAVTQLASEQELVALDPEADACVQRVQSIAGIPIQSPEDRGQIDLLGAELRRHRDVHELEYRRYKDPVVKLGQFFDAAIRKVRSRLDAAIMICDGKVLAYDRVRAAEAERERQRLQRIADEQAARDQARLIKEMEKATQQAKGLERQVLREEVKTLKQSTPVGPTVWVPTTKEEMAGQKTRKYWSAEVTELLILARAVIAGEVPSEAIAANMTFLNTAARSLARDDGTNGMNVAKSNGQLPYPGVRAVYEERRSR